MSPLVLGLVRMVATNAMVKRPPMMSNQSLTCMSAPRGLALHRVHETADRGGQQDAQHEHGQGLPGQEFVHRTPASTRTAPNRCRIANSSTRATRMTAAKPLAIGKAPIGGLLPEFGSRRDIIHLTRRCRPEEG